MAEPNTRSDRSDRSEITKLSDETIDWLYGYLNASYQDGEDYTKAPNSVIKELEPYKPTEPVRLYRGIMFYKPKEEYKSTTRTIFTSWSRSPHVSAIYAEDGILITTVHNPADILVDIGELRGLGLIYVPANEEELLVYPGTYPVELLREEDYI